MNETTAMEELLWRYVEGDCTVEELSFVEKMLATSEQWQTQLSVIAKLHAALGAQALVQPGTNFTAQVLQAVQREQVTVKQPQDLLSLRAKVISAALFVGMLGYFAINPAAATEPIVPESTWTIISTEPVWAWWQQIHIHVPQGLYPTLLLSLLAVIALDRGLSYSGILQRLLAR